jgi:hypothetical protein
MAGVGGRGVRESRARAAERKPSLSTKEGVRGVGAAGLTVSVREAGRFSIVEAVSRRRVRERGERGAEEGERRETVCATRYKLTFDDVFRGRGLQHLITLEWLPLDHLPHSDPYPSQTLRRENVTNPIHVDVNAERRSAECWRETERRWSGGEAV